MEDLISVIIPAFNIEKYIYDCLKSIQRQTYKNLEVVIVDDGSTDHTGKICDDFCKGDSRFIVVHQVNQGQAHARNIAYKMIHGKFITYVDGDDVTHQDMIKLFVEAQNKTGADIVQGSHHSFFDSEYERIVAPALEKKHLYEATCDKQYTPNEALYEYLYARKFTNSPWAKLIKAELMSDLKFPINRGYEDGAIMYMLYGKAKKLVYIPTELYYYRQRLSSTMRTSFNHKKLDRLLTAEELKSYITRFYPENVMALNTRYCMSMLQVLMWLPFNRTYSQIREDTFGKLKTKRILVIRDKDAPIKIRGMLVASYLGVWATMVFGRIYRFLTKQ